MVCSHKHARQHNEAGRSRKCSIFCITLAPALVYTKTSVCASPGACSACAAARRSKAYCPAVLRTWASRWPRIAGELAAYQPHILCMQVSGGAPALQTALGALLAVQPNHMLAPLASTAHVTWCHVPLTTCHMSHVVTHHLPHFTCHMLSSIRPSSAAR